MYSNFKTAILIIYIHFFHKISIQLIYISNKIKCKIYIFVSSYGLHPLLELNSKSVLSIENVPDDKEIYSEIAEPLLKLIHQNSEFFI